MNEKTLTRRVAEARGYDMAYREPEASDSYGVRIRRYAMHRARL